MPVVENWVVSVTAQSSVAARRHGDEPWWVGPGHRRGCAEEISLGRFMPMPASRPGASQGVWGEVGEDGGEEIQGKVAPHSSIGDVEMFERRGRIYTTQLVVPGESCNYCGGELLEGVSLLALKCVTHMSPFYFIHLTHM
jgi:hypothetical protein